MGRPFKRITNVTPKIADNWQKYYFCMDQISKPLNRACEEQSKLDDIISLWRQLFWASSGRGFWRSLNDGTKDLATIYASGWVLIERKDSVEVGVLVDHNEEHKTQLEITTKISHLATGQLVGSTFTARLDEPIEMETPECRIRMTITEVPMEGGA